ncbi:hypothetical protein [Pelagerythrobacter sp.]|uniref:hypothetical protein n=1 Tax=Pelagerythrobacter sp. TaxID=2800702 RepID=UPI0035B46F08
MTSPAAIIASLLVLFGSPAPAGPSIVGDSAPAVPRTIGAEAMQPGWIMLDALHADPVQHQVRIEQRVIIRVAPHRTSPREPNLSSLAEVRPSRIRPAERETECLPVAAIGAVQPARDNRLMLYMRDRRMFAVELERSCSARDFYSGFYLERRSDGMMCADRDRLQSRTGSRCTISALNQMVAERD